MTDVRRNATGQYKCSLTDKSMMDSTTITVHCKSLHFALLGRMQTDLGPPGMVFLLYVCSLVQLPTGEEVGLKECPVISIYSNVFLFENLDFWPRYSFTSCNFCVVYGSITLSHTVRILVFYISLMLTYIGKIILFQLCLRMYTNMEADPQGYH